MRNCEHCGREFKPAKAIRRFCSRRCSNLGAPRHGVADGLTFYERNAERIKAERKARYADDPAALAEAGIAYATDQIIDLLSWGVEGIHLYTMNRPETTRRIMDNIGLVRRSLVDRNEGEAS